MNQSAHGCLPWQHGARQGCAAPTGLRKRARQHVWIRGITGIFTVAILGVLAISAPAAADSELDYGDAPVSYELSASSVSNPGPARAAVGRLMLGSSVTADEHVAPDAAAVLDADWGDDGVSGVDSLGAGTAQTLVVQVMVSGAADGARICGWLDLDLSRTFESGERSCSDLADDRAIGAGTTASGVSLNWSGTPRGVGESVMRVRVAADPGEASQPVGLSATGEVEDYAVPFVDDLAADRTNADGDTATADDATDGASSKPELSAKSAESGLRLKMSVNPKRVDSAGDRLTFTYVATNTGDGDVERVRVVDEQDGLKDWQCDHDERTTLAADERMKCTATRSVTQRDLDAGRIQSEARVLGESAPDGVDLTAIDEASVDVRQKPRLRMDLALDQGSFALGEQAVITAAAVNVGNVSLSSIELSAQRDTGGLPCSGADPTVLLAPGEAVRCTTAVVVGAADLAAGQLVVRARASAEGPAGDRVLPSDDITAAAEGSVNLAAAGSGRLPGMRDAQPAEPSTTGEEEPGGDLAAAGRIGSGADSLPDTGGPHPALITLGLVLVCIGSLLLAAPASGPPKLSAPTTSATSEG